MAPTWRRRALDSRRLYLCTGDRPDLERYISQCIEGGVDVVQLRDKQLDDDGILRRSEVVRRVCTSYGVPFVLNDRPDLAKRAAADGVHVGQEDMSPATARQLVGPDAIVGLSTHASDQLAAALAEDVDYISVGPVVPTPTKPGRPGTGLEYVTEAARVCATVEPPMPFFVTGDARPATVAAMVRAGARRLVVVRWLSSSEDPSRAARQLIEAMDDALGGSGG